MEIKDYGNWYGFRDSEIKQTWTCHTTIHVGMKGKFEGQVGSSWTHPPNSNQEHYYNPNNYKPNHLPSMKWDQDAQPIMSCNTIIMKFGASSWMKVYTHPQFPLAFDETPMQEPQNLTISKETQCDKVLE